jgi:hypothetical protein
MLTIFPFFITLQIILLFMTLHDWVHLPPFTDIRELEKHSSKTERLINSFIFCCLILFPLSLTLIYNPSIPYWPLLAIAIDYGVCTLGTICAWWIPYFFGSSKTHKEGFAEYRNTHTFLPARGDNVIPNTFHIILHLQIWTCFAIACYLLMR